MYYKLDKQKFLPSAARMGMGILNPQKASTLVGAISEALHVYSSDGRLQNDVLFMHCCLVDIWQAHRVAGSRNNFISEVVHRGRLYVLLQNSWNAQMQFI